MQLLIFSMLPLMLVYIAYSLHCQPAHNYSTIPSLSYMERDISVIIIDKLTLAMMMLMVASLQQMQLLECSELLLLLF